MLFSYHLAAFCYFWAVDYGQLKDFHNSQRSANRLAWLLVIVIMVLRNVHIQAVENSATSTSHVLPQSSFSLKGCFPPLSLFSSNRIIQYFLLRGLFSLSSSSLARPESATGPAAAP